MAELLALSVTLNLFLLWAFFTIRKAHHRIMQVLLAIARGEASITPTDEGFEIRAKVKTI